MEAKKLSQSLSEVSNFLFLLWHDKVAFVSLCIFLGIVLMGSVGAVTIPQTVVTNVDFAHKLLPPSQAHWFGTDDYGRDLMSLCILAADTDISYSLAVVAGSVAIGALLGAVSALLPRTDLPLQGFTDIFLAMPGLVLAMGFAAAAGHSIPLLAVAIILAWWPIYSRLVRGQVLVEAKKPYVLALQAFGISKIQTIFRHLLPNTFVPVLARATTDIGWIIVTLSSLNFIGFGPGPYVPEWGSLVAAGKLYIFQAPWLIAIPGLFIFLTSVSLNFIGDWLRDLYDPRSSKRRGVSI